MTARQISILAFVAFVAILTGCQPPPSRKNELRIGRNARGPTGPINSATGTATRYNSGNTSTTWGQLTSTMGDQGFDDQLYYFTLPMLNGLDASQQLGYVSASAGQSTFVSFWGEASIYSNGSSGSGTLDGAHARIHIEIWDNKAVASGANPVVVHIGYDFPGFVSATGSVNGSQATLTFTDGYGSVALQGTLSNQMFSGTMYFSNSATSSQFYPLGNFQVSACGFFVCN